ncbi:UPF0223 family protein [uncultured Enterococcus sp.]|mgnify:FL=1|uniref:UPF0223 family protein n=1 Tax=uncultured Enterococcus sp. TaxID=167972 RepID=UPI00259A2582|nr:UPF0223 family protein [uncultured Enterococcus sp.]
MNQNYEYTLNLDWNTEEMVAVIAMWNAVEKAYEKGVQISDLLTAYQDFKKVVPSIGEEKQLGKQFESSSSYSLYRTIKNAKEKQKGVLKMRSDD